MWWRLVKNWRKNRENNNYIIIEELALGAEILAHANPAILAVLLNLAY